MNEFLNRVIGNNQVKDYLFVFAVILLTWGLSKLISKFLAILLCKLIKRTWKSLDQRAFIDLIIQPLATFVVITVAIVSLYRLHFPPELNITLYKYTLQRTLVALAVLFQIGAFIWLNMRIIDFIAAVLQRKAELSHDQSDNQLVVFFRDFLKVIMIIIGLVLILHFSFNFNIGRLITGLSIVGAAIALSLRESLENLIASFVIFFDKPFMLGDSIKVQNITGTVEKIGLRSTRVRTTDKSYVTIPNKQMVDSILDNISRRSQIRGELLLNIHVQTEPLKIQALIRDTKEFLKGIEEIENHAVLFNDIKIPSFVIFIEFFTIPIEWNRFLEIKEQLNFFVLDRMEKLEIRIASKE
jgi:MscS family membrane protein